VRESIKATNAREARRLLAIRGRRCAPTPAITPLESRLAHVRAQGRKADVSWRRKLIALCP
jgi:hypothetical protein